MEYKKNNCAVIFGGSGFVGAFFAEFLALSNQFSKIFEASRSIIKLTKHFSELIED